MFGLEGLNWMAVIVAAVLYFIIGAIWYGPLFSKPWAAGMGITTADASGVPAKLGLVALMGLIVVTVLALLLKKTGATELGTALETACTLWLGLTAATTASEQIMDTRPWSVWLINKGYHLVALLVAAAVLTYMR